MQRSPNRCTSWMSLSLIALVCACEKQATRPAPAGQPEVAPEAKATAATPAPALAKPRVPQSQPAAEPAGETRAPSNTSTLPPVLPSGHPPIPSDPTAQQLIPPPSGNTLDLTGLTMTIPDGWTRLAVKPGAFSAKAAFQLPGGAGDDAGCRVRVTHYPGMKGKNDLNIQRWLSQVKQADGSASTRDNAKVSTVARDDVTMTLLDVTGVVNTSMDGTGAGQTDYRLIAAILDHPDGPHFIKASGDSKSMAKWAESISAFLESATTK